MSAPLIPHPVKDPEAVWPGHAPVDATGATIARDMLIEMERIDKDAHGLVPAEYCQLENWTRQGRPFRNIVAECAARAQGIGPEALSAFYAVLSDFLAAASTGCVPDAGIYDRICGDEEPST